MCCVSCKISCKERAIMTATLIPLASSPEKEKEAFANLTTIYTDLDGTLLAPGGCLLTDTCGAPSYKTCEAVVALQRAGVDLIVVTGRSRVQCNEFVRILNAKAVIGEMGCTKQEHGTGNLNIAYDTGEFDFDSTKFNTPYDAIAASGAVEVLFERYKGKLEYNYPRCLNRDVTHAMRGCIDPDEAAKYLKSQGFNLEFEDNGMIFSPSKTTLVDCSQIHGYHIVPAGTSKAKAVKDDMEQRGILPNECVSIGDGHGDIYMGQYTGSFVMMVNGLKQTRNVAATEALDCPHKFVTNKICNDGWIEFANAVLRAKGAPLVSTAGF